MGPWALARAHMGLGPGPGLASGPGLACRRLCDVAVRTRSRSYAAELLVEVGEAADVLSVGGECKLLDARAPASGAGGAEIAFF